MHFLRKIAFVAFLTPFAFIQADEEEVIVTANKKSRNRSGNTNEYLCYN
jgi:hypothetical protein